MQKFKEQTQSEKMKWETRKTNKSEVQCGEMLLVMKNGQKILFNNEAEHQYKNIIYLAFEE